MLIFNLKGISKPSKKSFAIYTQINPKFSFSPNFNQNLIMCLIILNLMTLSLESLLYFIYVPRKKFAFLHEVSLSKNLS